MSRVRDNGIMAAAPAPCTARAAMSQPAPGASAHAADPAANRPMPVTNNRRRPHRPPSAPPVTTSTANARVYALTVHSSSSTEAPRSTRIVLRAVDTTNASSPTISAATAVRPITQRCAEVHLIVTSCLPIEYSSAVMTPATARMDRPSRRNNACASRYAAAVRVNDGVDAAAQTELGEDPADVG